MTLPDTPGTLHLNALASVTTKGNALFVEVWDTAVSFMPFFHASLIIEATLTSVL